jgi:hypothetical protein
MILKKGFGQCLVSLISRATVAHSAQLLLKAVAEKLGAPECQCHDFYRNACSMINSFGSFKQWRMNG